MRSLTHVLGDKQNKQYTLCNSTTNARQTGRRVSSRLPSSPCSYRSVSPCLCGQGKCVVTKRSCAHHSHRRQPNPLPHISSHLSRTELAQLSALLHVFSLSFSLSSFILPLCLCCTPRRKTHTYTYAHIHMLAAPHLWLCRVVEYVYANEAEVVCWCHSVTDRPCSRLIQGAGVSHSGWLATFLPFPSHPETILTLSPSAYPTSCWRFMTSWLPHSLPVPPSSLFSRLWVFCMEMCSPFSAGLRSYLAGLTSFIYCIGFSSFSFWTRGHRNLPAALLFVFHFPNSHFLSLIPTAALLLCIVLFPPPPLSFSSWFLWSLIFFDYICFNLCSSLLSAGFHSS